jgi:hypothetical protein
MLLNKKITIRYGQSRHLFVWMMMQRRSAKNDKIGWQAFVIQLCRVVHSNIIEVAVNEWQ